MGPFALIGVIMHFKQALWILLLSLCLGTAMALDVPEKVDREQTMATFEYTVVHVGGAWKEQWQIILDGDGTLKYSGLYLGGNHAGCSYVGGKARLSVTKETHSALMVSAISALKENEKLRPSNPTAISPTDSYPRLFVELGNEAQSNDVKAHEKATKEFQEKIALIVNSLSGEKQVSRKFLEYRENRDFKSRDVQAFIKNAGSDELQFDLPATAGKQLSLQMGDGVMRELSYAKKPAKLSYKLKPGHEVKVDLVIPADIAPSSGLVVFENFSEQQSKKKPLKRVRLCAMGFDGQRRP